MILAHLILLRVIDREATKHSIPFQTLTQYLRVESKKLGSDLFPIVSPSVLYKTIDLLAEGGWVKVHRTTTAPPRKLILITPQGRALLDLLRIFLGTPLPSAPLDALPTIDDFLATNYDVLFELCEGYLDSPIKDPPNARRTETFMRAIVKFILGHL